MIIPYCILVIEDDDDREFMTFIYQSYHRLIYHEVRKIVEDPWAAEDIMQEVTVTLIDKVKELRAKEERQMINYIIAISQNKAKNFARAAKAHGEVPFEAGAEAGTRVTDDLDSRLMRECDIESLARIWPRLSERSRYLLEGRYVLEKSVEQLAEELRLQPGSVRMALTRARREAYSLFTNDTDSKA